MALVPKAPPKIPADLQKRAVIVGIGDSNTARAGSSVGMVDIGYLEWIRVLGGGKYIILPHVGGGGYGSDRIDSELVPIALAMTPKPTHAVIHGGTNDTAGDIRTLTMASLLHAYRTLRGAGVTPITCSTLPKAGALSYLAKVRHWVARTARENGWPYVDVHAATVDVATGGFISGWSLDGFHTEAPAAKAWGQQVINVLSAADHAWSAPLVDYNIDPDNMIVAPLFLSGFDDTDGNLLPDTTGSASSKRYGYGILSGGANAAITYASDPGNVLGRWLEITLTNTAGISIVFKSNENITVTNGDTWAFGCRAQLSGTGTASAATLAISKSDAIGNTVGGGFPLNAISQDFGPVTLWNEWQIANNPGAIRLNIILTGAVGTKLRLGQMTLKNVTALGIV